MNYIVHGNIEIADEVFAIKEPSIYLIEESEDK